MIRSKRALRALLGVWRAAVASPPLPRRPRQTEPRLNSLEDRVVLSRVGLAGHGLADRLTSSQVSQATTGTMSISTFSRAGSFGAFRGGAPRGFLPGRSSIVQDQQLATDLDKLRTDTDAVLSGSSVTDAQRQALANDMRSIRNADSDLQLDKTALSNVVDTLLTALADGSYDANTDTAASIKSSFTTLFDGSSVDQSLIDQTFTDLLAVARGLNISTDELNTLSTDRAAITADLTRLGIDTTHPGPGQSNVDLVLSPGFGRPRGHGRF
jgi:hypothetical protein